MRTVTKFLLGALLAVAALGQTALARDSVADYKLSVMVGTRLAWGEGARIWADLVRQQSAGRLNLELVAGGAANGGASEFQALASGQISAAVGSALDWSADFPALGLFSLPFFLADYGAVDAVLGGASGQMLVDELAERGIVALAWGENGYRQLSTASYPITSPADLKGLRLHAASSEIITASLELLGASSSNDGWAQAQAELATGALDGQENSLAILQAPRLARAKQAQITLWNHVMDPLIFAVSQTVWDGWSSADQNLVRAAAREAAQRQTVLARQGLTSTDDRVLKQLRASGISVTILSPAQIGAFAAATAPIIERFTPSIGRKLVLRAQADIARP